MAEKLKDKRTSITTDGPKHIPNIAILATPLISQWSPPFAQTSFIRNPSPRQITQAELLPNFLIRRFSYFCVGGLAMK